MGASYSFIHYVPRKLISNKIYKCAENNCENGENLQHDKRLFSCVTIRHPEAIKLMPKKYLDSFALKECIYRNVQCILYIPNYIKENKKMYDEICQFTINKGDMRRPASSHICIDENFNVFEQIPEKYLSNRGIVKLVKRFGIDKYVEFKAKNYPNSQFESKGGIRTFVNGFVYGGQEFTGTFVPVHDGAQSAPESKFYTSNVGVNSFKLVTKFI